MSGGTEAALTRVIASPLSPDRDAVVPSGKPVFFSEDLFSRVHALLPAERVDENEAAEVEALKARMGVSTSQTRKQFFFHFILRYG